MSSRSSFTLSIQDIKTHKLIHALNVKWYYSIKDIKDQLHALINVPPRSLQLYRLGSLVALRNTETLHDLSIDISSYTLALSISSISSTSSSNDNTLYDLTVANEATPIDTNSQSLLNTVRLGLQRNYVPKKTDVLDSTGGVYFMRGITGNYAGVFKPSDEEQGMISNDKGYAGNGDNGGLRSNFKPGQGCIRELAAYIFDVDNVAGVPPVALVYCQHNSFNYKNVNRGYVSTNQSIPIHPKLGSLQKFVESKETFDDLGPSKLSDYEVQKIALFDMRILNCDRNAANILAVYHHSNLLDHNIARNNRSNSVDAVKRRYHRSNSLSSHDSNGGYYDSGTETDIFFDIDDDDSIMSPKNSSNSMYAAHESYTLIPIDHGYAFPTKLNIMEWDWSWLHHPQIKKPVHPELVKYMNRIDINKTIELLNQHVTLPEEALYLVRLSHQLLLDGINAGLTLYDIACMIARLDEDVVSSVERIVSEAEENAFRTIEMKSNRFTTNTAIARNSNSSSSSSSGVSSSRYSNHLKLSINTCSSNDLASLSKASDTNIATTPSKEYDSIGSCTTGESTTGESNSDTAARGKDESDEGELSNSPISPTQMFLSSTFLTPSSTHADGIALKRMNSIDVWTSPQLSHAYRGSVTVSSAEKPSDSYHDYSNYDNDIVGSVEIANDDDTDTDADTETPTNTIVSQRSNKNSSPSITVKKGASSSNSTNTVNDDTDSNGNTSQVVTKSSLSMKSSIVRIASFAGFESASFIDFDDVKERRYTKLARLKRKQVQNTGEWNKLKSQFATKAVNLLIIKSKRSKAY